MDAFIQLGDIKMSDLFETATKARLRFKTTLGVLATEDLWGLSLQQLDDSAKALHKELQDTEVSFIDDVSPFNKAVQLKLDVVKRVIEVKLAERDGAKEAKEKLARKRLLQEALHDKKNDALKAKSVEEIEKELADL